MRVTGWCIVFLLCASTILAQSLNPGTELLLQHAKADKDIFGAGSPNGFSLEDQVRRTNSDIQLQSREDEWIPEERSDRKLSGTRKSADIFVKRMVAENDIAIIGMVDQQISILNSHKSKIVTDSLITITDVLHQKSGFDLKPGDRIVVSRPGGEVHIDNHRVRIQTADFPPFVVATQYLLFLTRNKSTGSYLIRPDGAFLIHADTISPLSEKGKYSAALYLDSATGFLNRIRIQVSE